MTDTLGVGVVGCGNISNAYFSLAKLFKGFEIRACADLNSHAAAEKAKTFSVRAEPVEDLLKAGDIDIVVNLTVPSAHFAVTKAALEAGKHVYTEKPYVLTVDEGRALGTLAAARKLRIGAAPDTFLGGGHQLARSIIDSGEVGRITSGTAFVMSHGMEHRHPNPGFFYLPGGGPILDMGPYYVTDLVQLIGPVARVAAFSSIPAEERTITCQPRYGEKIPVRTPTTIHSILEFRNGAIVTLVASWDVWANAHKPVELYGEKGSVYVPDPNFFGGAVHLTSEREPISSPSTSGHPLGIDNFESSAGPVANYRGVGLADMAAAILEDRPHRCSSQMALHTIEVMTGILEAGKTGMPIAMETTCERPQALGAEEADGLLVAPSRQAA